MVNVGKEEILAKVNSYEILDHYLRPYHNFSNLSAAKNISNPFLAEKQETPSFNIFPAMKTGEWRYNDFATEDNGSCFDLVMRLNNLSFPETLNKINSDFMLMLDSEQTPTRLNRPMEKPVSEFQLKKKPFNEEELKFWLKFGIKAETLERFKVVSIAEFSTTSKIGNPYTVRSNSEKFIFAYENANWVKLYKPLDEKKYKFQYLGTKEPNYIFGWQQLPEKDEMLIITGGEKDVMSLDAKGFNAIALNSETANLDKSIVDELKLRFNKIVVLYDNDDTGLKQSSILSVTHGLHRLVLPIIANNGKDISDFFANGETLENLNELLSNTIKEKAPEVLNPDKVVFNAVELMAMGNLEPKYLMHPIFPQKGSAVLAGKPDTGKSQFARQLCIQVALGSKTFLDFELTPFHKRAIYVATEDNQEATTFLVSKQFKGLNEEAVENLRFIFADTMDQEEILVKINEELNISPADLVVIDSFGDIFKGSDSNNNMAMRNTVKLFDKISKEHNCLILFVHHINKAAYRQAPGQEHIQGGSGLVQKVRLAIQLSEGEGNKRYFTVVKGNYCPKEYKQNSLELLFSEETFLFTNTGILIPTADLGTQPDNAKTEEKYNVLEEIAQTIFSDNLLSYNNFAKEFCQITGKSVPTAKRAHSNLVKLGLIVKFNGAYRLASKNENTIDDEDFDDNKVVSF